MLLSSSQLIKMNIQDLVQDVLTIIYKRIVDRTFIRLIQTNKFFNQQKLYKKLINNYHIMNIKHVVHDYNFTTIIYNNENQLSNYFPKTLMYIILVNITINSKLPDHIKIVKLPYLPYNLMNFLPNNITALSITDIKKDEAKEIDNLPNSLKFLQLHRKYIINCKLPENITYLDVSYDTIMNIKLPVNLKKMILNIPHATRNNIVKVNLPEKIKFLQIQCYSDDISTFISSLPDSIVHLDITGQCDILQLPKNLKILKCRKSSPNSFPDSLKILHIEIDSDIFVNMPRNLEKLYIDWCNTNIFEDITSFPQSLNYISLPYTFSYPIAHLVNPNIRIVYKLPLLKKLPF